MSILITKESWLNSQLSIARFYGGIILTGADGKKHDYLVVNSKGSTDWVHIDEKEPADLVDKRFIPYYQKLGRDRFLQVLRDNPQADHKTIVQAMKREVEQKKVESQPKPQTDFPVLDFV